MRAQFRSPAPGGSPGHRVIYLLLLLAGLACAAETLPHTRVGIVDGRWEVNGRPTNPGSAAEGLLMNVRMVNAVFEDRAKHTDFEPDANTARFVACIPDYAQHGVNAFTICLQGGMPGYEGAVNSAFEPDGSLRTGYLARVERVIHACDQQGVVVILGLYYQRQSAILRDDAAIRAGVVNAARWVRERGFQNVLLEIANEYPHKGFAHAFIRDPNTQAALIHLARQTAPGLLVSASGYGDGRLDPEIAEAADFLLPHWNSTTVEQIPARIQLLKKFGKPVVANEDDKTGADAVAALRASVDCGGSYGLMLNQHNQRFPFHFNGAEDDAVFYAELHRLTEPASQAGLWRKDSPESQGFSAAKLEALREGLAARQTKALLVVRNDTIVCEWYAPGQNANTRFGTASLAKALVGGVSFAVAMSDGRIGLDAPAARLIPQWRDSPQKARITPRQLGSHTSGIEDAEADNKPHAQLTGWKGDFWKHLAVPDDPFTLSRDRAPVVFEPGAEMRYSNPGIALLTYCVTASLRDAPQKDIRSLLRERVLRPIGVPDAEWSAGYGKTSTVDGLPLVGSWGGATFTARAAARVGRLMLRGGDWDGQRILSAEAVRLTTSDAGTPGPCGIGWWSNNEGDCARLPLDAFFGSGAGHQILLVVPSLNLLVVRFGATLAETGHRPGDFHEAYRLYLFQPLMEAISDPGVKPAPRRNTPGIGNPEGEFNK